MENEDIPVSVVILTYNEEENIGPCLESVVEWAGEVYVVDSYSEDRTVEIAKEYTDHVVQHEFVHYGRQRNWAMEELPLQYDWVFHLDADERVMPELAEEIQETFLHSEPDSDGFLVKKRMYFMGRWIKHGWHYPVYHMRLFRNDAGQCEEREYDQHFICDGDVQKLQHDIKEESMRDLSEWVARHNRWSTGEAEEVLKEEKRSTQQVEEDLTGTPIQRRRFLKNRIYYRMPLFLRAFLYYIYRYFLRLGFLDGKEGLIFHFLQGFWVRFLVDAKIYEQRLRDEKE